MFALRLASAAALLATAALAHAQTTVADAWVRATVPQQAVTGAFLTLTSAQGGALVKAASPVAASVEVHEMKMENNVMKMAAVEQLALPAGKAVALQPGGYHLMLLGLKQQVQVGSTVPLTLTIQGADGKAETLEVKADVRALGAAQPDAHSQHQH